MDLIFIVRGLIASMLTFAQACWIRKVVGLEKILHKANGRLRIMIGGAFQCTFSHATD